MTLNQSLFPWEVHSFLTIYDINLHITLVNRSGFQTYMQIKHTWKFLLKSTNDYYHIVYSTLFLSTFIKYFFPTILTMKISTASLFENFSSKFLSFYTLFTEPTADPQITHSWLNLTMDSYFRKLLLIQH